MSGDGTYHPSKAFTPRKAGDYWWYASYGGDGGNTAAVSSCGASMARIVVIVPPSVSIKAARGAVTSGTTTISLTCSGGPHMLVPWQGDADDQTAHRRTVHGHRKVTFRTITLGSSRYRIASGTKKTITVRLTSAGSLALQQARGHRLTTVLTVTVQTGHAATRKLTLRPA